MKPWQALLNAKHAAKGEKGRSESKDPSPSQKCKSPKRVTKGQRLFFRTPTLTSSKKHIREGQGRET
jgi:hypothetical protein